MKTTRNSHIRKATITLGITLCFALTAGACSEDKKGVAPPSPEAPLEAPKEKDSSVQNEATKKTEKRTDKVDKKTKKAEAPAKPASEKDALAPATKPLEKNAKKAAALKEKATKPSDAIAKTKEERQKRIEKEKALLERATQLAGAKPTPQTRGNAPTTRTETAAPAMPKAPVPPIVSAVPPLPIAHALNAAELSQLTGHKFIPDQLKGQIPSPRYNSLYYRTKRAKKFGISVQLWHEPALKDTRARYEQMKASYPNMQETGNITNYTFFSHWNNLYHLVFMDLKRRRVTAISTEELTPDQLFTVATRVRDRLLR